MILELCLVATALQAQGAAPPESPPFQSTPTQSPTAHSPPAGSSPARSSPAQSPPAEASISIEDEVRANLQGTQLGPDRVADLALPEEFQRRISDRIIRSSFEDRYRIVVADPHSGAVGAHAVLAAPPADAPPIEPLWRRPWIVGAVLLVVLLLGIVAVLSARRRRGAA